jgi:hypothetical protein
VEYWGALQTVMNEFQKDEKHQIYKAVGYEGQGKIHYTQSKWHHLHTES